MCGGPHSRESPPPTAHSPTHPLNTPPTRVQILHDAFFKYQTKPKLTKMGDLYYEGKEYETDVKNAIPGA